MTRWLATDTAAAEADINDAYTCRTRTLYLYYQAAADLRAGLAAALQTDWLGCKRGESDWRREFLYQQQLHISHD